MPWVAPVCNARWLGWHGVTQIQLGAGVPWSSTEFQLVNFHGFYSLGKLSHSYGKSPCLMGKSTISMTIFNSYFDITRGYMIFIEVIFLLESRHIRTFSGQYVVGFFPSSAVMSSPFSTHFATAEVQQSPPSEARNSGSKPLERWPSSSRTGIWVVMGGRRRPVTAMEHGHG